MKGENVERIKERIRGEAERLGSDPVRQDLVDLGLLDDPIEFAAKKVVSQLIAERKLRNSRRLWMVAVYAMLVVAILAAVGIGYATGEWIAAWWALIPLWLGYAAGRIQQTL